MKSTNVKNLVMTAMFAAILCVLGPLALPIGPVPISLGTMGLYLIAIMLPWKNALAAVVVYLLLGMVGLPIFSGFSGGLAKLAGPTGGYLAVYLPCVFIISVMVQKLKKPLWHIAAMILGTVVLYAFGSVWFMISMEVSLMATLAACVLPFLIGDGIKIAAAFGIGLAWKKRGDL